MSPYSILYSKYCMFINHDTKHVSLSYSYEKYAIRTVLNIVKNVDVVTSIRILSSHSDLMYAYSELSEHSKLLFTIMYNTTAECINILKEVQYELVNNN